MPDDTKTEKTTVELPEKKDTVSDEDVINIVTEDDLKGK